MLRHILVVNTVHVLNQNGDALLTPAVGRCKRVAIRAHQAQIGVHVVEAVPIYMVQLKRCGFTHPLRYSTAKTLRFKDSFPHKPSPKGRLGSSHVWFEP